jgi:hypothetical protein
MSTAAGAPGFDLGYISAALARGSLVRAKTKPEAERLGELIIADHSRSIIFKSSKKNGDGNFPA